MYQQPYSEGSHSKQQSKKTFSIRIEEPVKMYAPARNQFKLSNNPRYNQEATLNLQKMKNLSKLLIDNKITSISQIFQIKLLNTLDHAFRSLNEATEPHLQTYTVKQEIELAVDSFVSKINNIYKNQSAKSKCLFMIHMKILFGRGRSENSKRQILRINSKLDRQTEQVDYFDKNISNETSSAEKTNKMLKKKKEQKEKEFVNFKQQMEQMLSYHESYLNKKN